MLILVSGVLSSVRLFQRQVFAFQPDKRSLRQSSFRMTDQPFVYRKQHFIFFPFSCLAGQFQIGASGKGHYNLKSFRSRIAGSVMQSCSIYFYNSSRGAKNSSAFPVSYVPSGSISCSSPSIKTASVAIILISELL